MGHYRHPSLPNATRKDRIYWRRRGARLSEVVDPVNSQNFPLTDGRIVSYFPHDASDIDAELWRSWTGDETGASDDLPATRQSGEVPTSSTLTESSADHWQAVSGNWSENSGTPVDVRAYGAKLQFGELWEWEFTPVGKSYVMAVCMKSDGSITYDSSEDWNNHMRIIFDANDDDVDFEWSWNAGSHSTVDSLTGLGGDSDDYRTGFLVWDHVAQRMHVWAKAGSNPALFSLDNVADLAVSDTGWRSGGFAWRDDHKHVAQMMLEFDALPEDWQAQALWCHEQWTSGNKSLPPTWGQHAKTAGEIISESAPTDLRTGSEWEGYAWYKNSVTFGTYDGIPPSLIGTIFVPDIDAAKDATITQAILTVRVSGATTVGSVHGTINVRAVKEGVPTMITEANEATEKPSVHIAAGNVTVGSVVDCSDWVAGEAYGIDVTDIVQELVQEADWDGSGIQFYLEPDPAWPNNDLINLDVAWLNPAVGVVMYLKYSDSY